MSEKKIASELRCRIRRNGFVDVAITAHDNGFERLIDGLEQMGANYTPREEYRTVITRLSSNDIRSLASKTYVAQISHAGDSK